MPGLLGRQDACAILNDSRDGKVQTPDLLLAGLRREGNTLKPWTVPPSTLRVKSMISIGVR